MLLLYPVLEGRVAHSVGHLPVLGGIDSDGEREYIVVDSRFRRRGGLTRKHSTITHGAMCAVFWDENGKSYVAESFWVPVLRFDVSEGDEESARAKGGADITGPFFWKKIRRLERW